jgi:hypothetical protein
MRTNQKDEYANAESRSLPLFPLTLFLDLKAYTLTIFMMRFELPEPGLIPIADPRTSVSWKKFTYDGVHVSGGITSIGCTVSSLECQQDNPKCFALSMERVSREERESYAVILEFVESNEMFEVNEFFEPCLSGLSPHHVARYKDALYLARFIDTLDKPAFSFACLRRPSGLTELHQPSEPATRDLPTKRVEGTERLRLYNKMEDVSNAVVRLSENFVILYTESAERARLDFHCFDKSIVLPKEALYPMAAIAPVP